MDFASKFALYASSSSEELDVDGLSYSDCEEDNDDQSVLEIAPPPAAPQQEIQQQQQQQASMPPPPPKVEKKKRRRKVRKADTNVLCVNLGGLADKISLATGDPVFCEQCRVVLSSISPLEECEDGEGQIWKCEFCGTLNKVDLDPEERPSGKNADYILVSPDTALAAAGGSKADADELVIFCVDVSGSMCVTTPVSGKQKLRGGAAARLEKMRRQYSQGFDQNMPNQEKNVTWVSRMQCMQAAIAAQLEALQKSSPKLRVALVTFSRDVCIVGDGIQASKTVAGAKLNSEDACFQAGLEYPLNTPVGKSYKKLTERVFSLEEDGSTALGPALMLSVGMASRAPGSRVIVCTDGMANVGVGALEDLQSEAEKLAAQKFYDELGLRAAKHGVSVSVVSIKGSDCRMENLGAVAEATKGNVEMVDPNNLTKEFASILEEKVVATKVSVELHLHSGLYVRDVDELEDVEAIGGEGSPSRVVRRVGIATESTKVTFEYGVKKQKNKTPSAATKAEPVAASGGKAEKPSAKAKCKPAPRPVKEIEPMELELSTDDDDQEEKKEGTDATQKEKVDHPKKLPFQVQIRYTRPDLTPCIRILTEELESTTTREKAEENVNLDLLASHALKKGAQLAMDGEYSGARLVAFQNKQLMKNCAKSAVQQTKYSWWKKNAVHKLESEIRSAQAVESLEGMDLSDSESDEDERVSVVDRSAPAAAPRRKSLFSKSKAKKKNARRARRGDTISTNLYQMSSARKFSMAMKKSSEDA